MDLHHLTLRYASLLVQGDMMRGKDILSSLPIHDSILTIGSTAIGIGGILLFRSMYSLIKDTKRVVIELTPPLHTQKTVYATTQFFRVLHTIEHTKTMTERLLRKKEACACEIIASRKEGIRYQIVTSSARAQAIQKAFRTYLPEGKMHETEDRLPEKRTTTPVVIEELTLTNHTSFPLAKQHLLTQDDPLAYLTGMMTKLKNEEVLILQLVLSPSKNPEAKTIAQKIARNEDIIAYLKQKNKPWFIKRGEQGLTIVYQIMSKIGEITPMLVFGSEEKRKKMKEPISRIAQEPEIQKAIQEKNQQPVFAAAIRIGMIGIQKEQKQKQQDMIAAISLWSVPGYQALKRIPPVPYLSNWFRWIWFKKRILSPLSPPMLLSLDEVSSLFHVPDVTTNKTENMVKTLSRELPAPLSLKTGKALDIVCGKNTYNQIETLIGLTQKERETHTYIIGRTGSGKTTMMFAMAKEDIQKGRGIAFIDPHGDVSEDLLMTIPKERKNDLIYLNPMDLKHPIGINLLELTPNLDEDEAELEKEVVCEGVVSLFRKLFSDEEHVNAHRIEYILRNTIYTAFTTKNPTLFTLYDLLNNPPYRNEIVEQLTDENLKNFWQFEFGKAGEYQAVKMASGVTAKIGRFIYSPTAKRMLEQETSTIQFDEIMNGKILICNVSQGNIGEDTAQVIGTTILIKLQQAALKRAKTQQRTPFYLYVDEFQNFATHSFIKMISEGRKYGLSVTIAEQSTSQQEEKRIVQTILANVTTVICFRSANPIDEQLMLAQFAPFIEKGDIPNLPRYHFYMKKSALEPEEPFSGETLFSPVKRDEQKRSELIEASQKNWTIPYQKKRKKTNRKRKKSTSKNKKNRKDTSQKTGLPEDMEEEK